jgi:hypothetical protein
MAISESDLKRAFHKAFSDDFLEDVIRLLDTVYLNAYQECRNYYPDEEAHDLRGHVRRAKLEFQLRELITRFPKMQSAVQLNEKRTSYFTTLYSGNVVMTANQVQHPSVIVRRALFRETYAMGAQLHLWEKEVKPPEDAYLYTILLHGEDALNPRRPGFAQIAFPNSDCNGYVIEHINLFTRFNDLVSKLWSVKEEKVKDELPLGLRESAKKKAKKKREQKG